MTMFKITFHAFRFFLLFWLYCSKHIMFYLNNVWIDSVFLIGVYLPNLRCVNNDFSTIVIFFLVMKNGTLFLWLIQSSSYYIPSCIFFLLLFWLCIYADIFGSSLNRNFGLFTVDGLLYGLFPAFRLLFCRSCIEIVSIGLVDSIVVLVHLSVFH